LTYCEKRVFSVQTDSRLSEIQSFSASEGDEKMEHIFDNTAGFTSGTEAHAEASAPGYESYQILRLGFTVAPIVAGLDKFFNLLVNWEQYLPPFVTNLVGGHSHELMLAVGVIEIIAGLGVFLKPKIFAYVVSAWLLLIVVNLLMIPGYYDVALRDFGLALGALALARLSSKFGR
jgi:hypothetical protein